MASPPLPAVTTPPVLFVISGPSGAGKGEAMRLLTDELDVSRVVTYTTRSPRPGEVDGESYHFLTPEKFWTLEKQGHFLEYSQTYGSHVYASPADLQTHDQDTGESVVELDPDGYQLVKRFSSRSVVGIFIVPPSIDVLVARITERSPASDLDDRIEAARRQLAQAWMYDHLVFNESLPDLMNTLRSCVALYRSSQRAAESLFHSLEEVRRHKAQGVSPTG